MIATVLMSRLGHSTDSLRLTDDVLPRGTVSRFPDGGTIRNPRGVHRSHALLSYQKVSCSFSGSTEFNIQRLRASTDSTTAVRGSLLIPDRLIVLLTM